MAYRNFSQVLRGLDVSMARAELARHPLLWEQFTVRQTYPGSAHHDTQCIVLRGPDPRSDVDVFDDLVSLAWPALDDLPHAVNLVLQLMARSHTRPVGRVMLARLRPGGAIDPHVDEGDYAANTSRYHIPIESGEGDAFTCGDETVTMLPGSCWWFNHRVRHHVRNNTPNWRTHLIVDLMGRAS